MSKLDFDGVVEAINAIPDSIVSAPVMPVSVAIQEAEDLVEWCALDEDALVKAGLNWELVTDLPVRAGACRYAQAVWARKYQTRDEAAQEWLTRSPQGFDLRDELVHDFYHAFNSRPDLIKKVQIIDEGGSADDMVQDLSDLAELGEANLPLLTAVGFDPEKLVTATQWSDELAVCLAKVNGERQDASEPKITRDRAYTYMKLAVDEIRRQGQYVFWRNPQRKKGYVSRFYRLKKTKSTKPAPTDS